MPIVLYHNPLSPPSRFALTTARMLGLEVIIKEIDIYSGEQFNPEFLKINPQHNVPTMDDNGFVLWESNAIATYLVEKYAKDDLLYPKDIYKRAMVDQRLQFTSGTLYPRVKAIVTEALFAGKKTVDAPDKKNLKEAYGFLEKFLEATGWIAGDHATLADIGCAVLLSNIRSVGFDLTGFPKTEDWLKRTSSIKGFQEGNEEGRKQFEQKVRSKLPAGELGF